MPNPALVYAGASLLGEGINAWAQGATNRAQRRWNESMYERQRADALADYHMQNEYNSPSAQMERLRKAGLNPNLVYGHGADAQGGIVRPTSAPAWTPKAPSIDLSGAGSGLLMYYDIEKREAETDNLRTQNTVLANESLLKMAQVLSTQAGTDKTLLDIDTGKFRLELEKALRENTMQLAAGNLRKMTAETDVLLRRDEREAAINSSNLREAAERILTMRLQRAKTQDERKEIQQRIESIKRDVRLKDLDIELKRLGIQPSDNMFYRMLGRVIGQDGPMNIFDKADDWLFGKKVPYRDKDGVREFIWK